MCLSLCVYFHCARVCTCVQQPVEDGFLHFQKSILIPEAFSNLERDSLKTLYLSFVFPMSLPSLSGCYGDSISMMGWR